MTLRKRLCRLLGWSAILCSSCAALTAQGQECVAGGDEDTPFPSYSILIGSTVDCSSVTTEDPEGARFAGCSITKAELEKGSASCEINFADGNSTWVDATLVTKKNDPYYGRVSFTTRDGKQIIKVVNIEGATAGNNCGFVFGTGARAALNLAHVKSNGQTTDIRSANFCSDGVAPEVVAPVVPEEDLEDCTDLLSSGVPPRHAAFVFNIDDLTYAGACFGASTTASAGIEGEVIDEACLDRCEPCDDSDDPGRCDHLTISGSSDDLSGLDCELSGNWSCPTGANCDWDPRPGVSLPYCWEVVSDPHRSGTYRRTQFQRGSYDARLGPVTTTNPKCFSYFVAGTQRTRCY
jgi:hypothetical protein